ncbi:MAG TPA: M28 family peptidase, partial [Rhodanobacteraceae bacterium]|nr:M28 family peptidase [Rhodanobacteraceae bacterium]
MRQISFAPAALASFALILAACGKQEPVPPAQTSAPQPAAPPKHPPVVPSPEGKTTPAITAEDFASRLKKISGDAFEGRKPGTIGERMSTAWIKDQFEQIGLKPGNGGNWFQTVPMQETTLLDPESIALDIAAKNGSERFAYRADMIVNSLDASHDVAIANSPIVFAGYGVVAPEQDWNDYAGIDVKGKTVVVLVNDPGWGDQDESLFRGRALTYYGRWTYKYEEAARQGAAACLIVHETPGAGYPWDVVVSSWSGPQDALPPREDPAPRLPVAGWITTDAAVRLFAKAGLDFAAAKKSADQPGFKPVTLDATLSTHFRNRIDHISSENVLGMIRGSTRPDEVVVYSAHWDHLGKDPALKGDAIYNGAIDNGTGIAGLMEIAEAFAHQDPPPQRSLLFAAFTLEEAGLLGSRYYATHPAFPLDKTVVVLVNDPGWGDQDESLFRGRALTYYGRWTYKYEEAARQGAAACLIVHETPGAGYPWDVVVSSWSGPQDALPPREDPAPRLPVAGWITTDAAIRLFAKAGLDFAAAKKSADQRGFKA